jgi:hypothetical protein
MKFGRDRLTVASDERDSDKRKSGSPGRSVCAPVAAMMFDPAIRPASNDLVALAKTGGAFAVTHQDTDAGLAELLRDGLTFDCLGLAPAAPLRMDAPLQRVALPGDFVLADQALVTLAPGPELGSAGQSLPAVRMLSGLMLALGELPGLRAVAWLPARVVMSPLWFAEAIGVWLKGGPFPALALTALVRAEQVLASRGLSYFIGQEFVFSGKDGILREADARGAVRLTDWLVAHGRVDTRREVELAGFGTVLLEPDGQNSLRARSL